MNRNNILGICTAALLATGASRAADIVNNLSAAQTLGWRLEQSGSRGLAQAFRAGPGTLYFTNVSLVLQNEFTPLSTIAVQLRADSGGLPGAIIETVTNAFTFTSFASTTYDLPAKGTNILVANTKYWIAAIWGAGTSVWYYTATTNSTGTGTLLDDDAYTFNGSTWSLGNANEVFKMAVRGA